MAADGSSDITNTLADALQKIENILADDRTQDTFYEDEITDSSLLSHKICNHAQSLRECVESTDASYLANHVDIPADTRRILLKWLHTLQPTFSCEQHVATSDGCRQKVARLENEKDSLLVQVGVLTDQVEVQGEKIRDLEFTKDELQIKVADVQERLSEAEDKVCQSENQCTVLKGQVFDAKNSFEKEKAKTGKNDPEGNEEMKEAIAQRDAEIEDLRTHLETLLDEEERGKPLSSGSDAGNQIVLKSQLREKASEVSRLKIKLEKVTSLLEEKDKHIEELQRQTVDSVANKEDEKAKTINSSGTNDVFYDHRNKIDQGRRLSAENLSRMKNNNMHGTAGTTRDNTGDKPARPKSSPVQNNVIHVSPHLPLKRDTQNKSRSSFGKGFLKFKKSRSHSEPNLSPEEDEPGVVDDKTVHQNHDDHHSEKGKKRSIVGKVFNKLRRSSSHDAPLNPEARDGDARTPQSDVPFSSWNAEMVATWLEDECLGQYADACANHIKTGEDLVKMSTNDLEKVLGMRRSLHRKKLHLALQAVTDQGRDVLEHLDNNWVLDWLDDIGLPQYKDSFRDNLVDGRMLNYLTVNDALQLKVYSTFHQHSLRRAIQCLRIHNFHPNYLKKSPIDESWQKGAHVVLWTNHRVTEWLRLADLSEYATNLRGSGVHGALMVLEPRFTAESLATLLSIPIGKKLLRRHLATHFDSLVGQPCMKVKETALANGLSPLLPGEKHKAIKKSLSIGGMKKRTKSEAESEEYICPMDTEVPLALQNIFSTKIRKNDGALHATDQKPEGPKGKDELTRSLGTFSKELNSLTDMLGHETTSVK